MVTLATLLLVYSLNSFVGGSGAIAALVFGLVVGNRNTILRLTGTKVRIETAGEKVHSFHDEITFFIRSFFFVFLGIIFSAGRHAGGWNVASPTWPFRLLDRTASLFLVGCLLILAAIVLIRFLVVRFISSRGHPEHLSLWAIFGRGLGTAVLCTFPFTVAAYEDTTSTYHALLSPFEDIFYNAALVIILMTVVGTSATVLFEEARLRRLEAGSTKG
jgi:cell volume regulation protein A